MAENMNMELEEKYLQAVDVCQQKISDEKITAARDAFLELGDYKESKAYLEKCERFLAYQPGSVIELGSWNGEPIQWKIYKKNGRNVLLLTEKTLENRQWHTERDHTNWSMCSLRRWLNKDFINDAFTLKERMMILLMQCDNNTDPRWSVENGPATRDKLFVFSKAELEEYIPNKEDRACGNWWWLRGHGNGLLALKSVDPEGNLYEIGVNKRSPNVGVRPAMWIRLPML